MLGCERQKCFGRLYEVARGLSNVGLAGFLVEGGVEVIFGEWV